MKSTPYTIHYGIGMLMNFEPLAYDTLKFEAGSSVVSLSDAEVGNKNALQSILEKNEKLNSVVTKHLASFPLFDIVNREPTDEYYFKIEKKNELTTYNLQLTTVHPARVKINIEVEAGSQITIIENFQGQVYVGYELNIIAGEGSKVDFVSAIQEPVMRTMLRNAYMGKDSLIVWHEAVIEGSLVQSHTRTYLYETGSRAEVKDLFALSSETMLDMYHSMYHLASHTTSDMLTKGVLSGKAKAMYQGLIHIDEKAVGCVGYQKQDSLVLSNNAEVNAVPNLEIENSDVKCSHGVTTAHIDKEKLFYAQSRGIDEGSAAQLFVDGHLSSCLDAIPDESKRTEVQGRIYKNLIS